jgi:hypothetical protein
MNAKSLSIALALVAGVGAQTQETVDATARTIATQAGQSAAKANDAAVAASAQAKAADEKNAAQTEQIDAIDGKLTGLEENFLETKATVDALKKLKISGLVQAQYVYRTDTNLVSSSRPLQQGLFQVRRGRLKATYDAGNGSIYVMQYNLNETGLRAQDMFVKWDEQWLKMFSVQMGLQDIPFGFETSYSSSSMETLERSRFQRNAMFADEKDVGIIFGASPKVPGLDAFGIKVAALNGYGAAEAGFDPRNIVGRVNFGKNFYEAGVGLDVGASFYSDNRQANAAFVAPVNARNAVKYKRDGLTSYDSITSVKKADEVLPGQYYVVDGSADYKFADPREELDAQVIGLDAQVAVDVSFIPTLTGAKFSGELYTGSAIGSSGDNKRTAYGTVLYKRELMGWYLTYVQNIGKSLQTVVRYDSYDPNTSVEGDEIGDKKANGGLGNGTSAADLAYDTWYFGLNVFLNGNTKVTLGYDLVRNETTKNIWDATPAKNFTEEIKDDILTLRGQFAF